MILPYYINLLPQPVETTNYIKKYGFHETKKGFRNAFTEIRKLGNYRYFIRSTMANTWSVCNHEDLESFIKYYTRL